MTERTTKSTRRRRILALSVTGALAISGALATPAFASPEDTSGDIPTRATLNQGTSTPPAIECAWAIPDQDNQQEGFQYKAPYDDDNVVQDAVANGADGPNGEPCYLPGPTSSPWQENGATHMTQVRPYAHDWNADPLDDRAKGEVGPPPGGVEDNTIQYANPVDDVGRLIETWAAVDKNNNVIQEVWADVYHPDGSFKLQVYGELVPCSPESAPALVPGSAMWQSAVNTGQVAPSAITDPSLRGMVDLCQQQQKDFYRIVWPISKEQMCGKYKVVVKAQSSNGTAHKSFYLDVQCFIHLEVDFDAVDFGTINTNQSALVTGNTLMEPVGTASLTGPVLPSVRNIGNTGMRVGVRFYRMSNGNQVNPKYITQFDAKFAKYGAPYIIDPINTDPVTGVVDAWFDTDLKRVLCANEIGKLDLSLHPDLQVPTPPPGAYAGKIVVLGAYQPDVCPIDLLTPDETTAPYRVDADGPAHSDDDPRGAADTTPHRP